MKRISLYGTVALIICVFCGAVIVWHILSRSEESSKPDEPPVKGASASTSPSAENEDEDYMDSDVWRLNSSDQLILIPSMSESQTGEIRYVCSGRPVATWDTGYMIKAYRTPLLIGSYPDQYAIVSYWLGGGTGFSWDYWSIVKLAGSESRLYEMGSYQYCSCWADNRTEFRIIPNLLFKKELWLDFCLTRLTNGQAEVIVHGRLAVVFSEDDAKLVPVDSYDAAALVQLLDEDCSRDWAGWIIKDFIPADLGRELSEKDWQVTDADKKALLQVLKNYSRREREDENGGEQ